LEDEVFPAPGNTRQGRALEFMLRVSANACKRKIGHGAGWRLANSEVIKLVCPRCKAKGQFRHHGHYYKNNTHHVKDLVVDDHVKIERLRCESCGCTHAVISFELVPWLSYSLRFILKVMDDWKRGVFSSIEKLCEAHLIAINTFYRLRKSFTAHIRLLLGACAPDQAVRDWLGQSINMTTVKLEGLCSGFLKAYGITLCQPRHSVKSKSTGFP
jgi:hypothetical protein